MIVRDSVFDVLLFGVLALALALDLFFASQLHGAATLLAVGLATYFAAQELSRGLSRRKIWTQESLATSVALSATGFFYYWSRNDADIILVALSLAFMMTSLMLLIAVVAAIGAASHGRSAQPVLGLIATFFLSLFLGMATGALVLALSSGLPLALRLGLVVVGAVAWKMREMARRKKAPESAPSSTRSNDLAAQNRLENVHAGGWTLRPERGTWLDRFAPILLLGVCALAFLAQKNRADSWTTAPAQAATAQAATAPVATTDSPSPAP